MLITNNFINTFKYKLVTNLSLNNPKRSILLFLNEISELLNISSKHLLAFYAINNKEIRIILLNLFFLTNIKNKDLIELNNIIKNCETKYFIVYNEVLIEFINIFTDQILEYSINNNNNNINLLINKWLYYYAESKNMSLKKLILCCNSNYYFNNVVLDFNIEDAIKVYIFN